MRDLGIDERIAAAREDLVAASGGRSLCRIDGLPLVKALEGRAAALADARQALRSASPGTALPGLLTTWRADLERNRARHASQDWIAYGTGGVEALEELIGDEGSGAT